MHTLPRTHPLARQRTRIFKRFKSPIQRMAERWHHVTTDNMETIGAYAIAPWQKRVPVVILNDREKAADLTRIENGQIIVTVASSERNGMVGIGGTIRETRGTQPIST
jgi:hypothetical protein